MKANPCTTCKYFRPSNLGPEFAKCGKSRLRYNRVIGRAMESKFFWFEYCAVLRGMRFPFLPVLFGNICGIRGKFWEPKV